LTCLGNGLAKHERTEEKTQRGREKRKKEEIRKRHPEQEVHERQKLVLTMVEEKQWKSMVFEGKSESKANACNVVLALTGMYRGKEVGGSLD